MSEKSRRPTTRALLTVALDILKQCSRVNGNIHLPQNKCQEWSEAQQNQLLIYLFSGAGKDKMALGNQLCSML